MRSLRNGFYLPSVFTACFLLILTSDVALSENEQGWICVGDMITGFEYVEGSGWRPSSFKPETYVVAKPDIEDIDHVPGKLYWVVKKIGEDSARHFCLEDGELFVSCEGILGSFTINKTNLRFQHIYPAGYLQDWRKDNPVIQIGKCTKF